MFAGSNAGRMFFVALPDFLSLAYTRRQPDDGLRFRWRQNHCGPTFASTVVLAYAIRIKTGDKPFGNHIEHLFFLLAQIHARLPGWNDGVVVGNFLLSNTFLFGYLFFLKKRGSERFTSFQVFRIPGLSGKYRRKDRWCPHAGRSSAFFHRRLNGAVTIFGTNVEFRLQSTTWSGWGGRTGGRLLGAVFGLNFPISSSYLLVLPIPAQHLRSFETVGLRKMSSR